VTSVRRLIWPFSSSSAAQRKGAQTSKMSRELGPERDHVMARVPSKYAFLKFAWPLIVWPIGFISWGKFVLLIAPPTFTQHEKAFAAILGLVGVLSIASMVTTVMWIFRSSARERH
jgi:hypothetical protein